MENIKKGTQKTTFRKGERQEHNLTTWGWLVESLFSSDRKDVKVPNQEVWVDGTEVGTAVSSSWDSGVWKRVELPFSESGWMDEPY